MVILSGSVTDPLSTKLAKTTDLAFYLFSPTRVINSIKHEHSCKILYVSSITYVLKLCAFVLQVC